MTTDLKKWIADLEQHVAESVEVAIEEVAAHAATLIEKDVDPNRQKTRDSVGYRMVGRRKAVVGLFFARKFSGNTRTVTHRTFRRTCQKIRPALMQRLIKTLNRKLQGD